MDETDLLKGLFVNGFYDTIKFITAYFISRGLYESVYKRWRYGNWQLIIMNDEEELVSRRMGPALAERVRDENELSVYVKGVVSPYTQLNIDITSERAKLLGLIRMDRKQRAIIVDLSKNPAKKRTRKPRIQQIREQSLTMRRYRSRYPGLLKPNQTL